MAKPGVQESGAAEERPRRRPQLFDVTPEEALAAALDPFSAPPPPEEGETADDPAAARALRRAARPKGGLGRWLWGAALALLLFALSVAAYDFAAAMLERNAALGAVATALAAAVALGLVLFALREAAAVARLGRVETVRDAAAAARASGDRAAAAAAVAKLRGLYGRRRDLDWAMADLKAQAAHEIDAEGVLDAAERAAMGPLDAAARAEVARAARRTAAATALIPIPVVDVLAALALNMAMIRSVAEVYGGRAGWLGSWRLLRAIAGHILATGMVSVGDDMIGPALGGGVASRVSRRLGEGLLNGALTARVGVAAIAVCRPLPFHALQKPSWRALAAAALRGVGEGV